MAKKKKKKTMGEQAKAIESDDAAHPWRVPGSTGAPLGGTPLSGAPAKTTKAKDINPEGTTGPASTTSTASSKDKPGGRTMPKREDYAPGLGGKIQFDKAMQAYLDKGLN